MFYLVAQNKRIGFYYKVSNTKKGLKVRFHIVNLAKKGSLYEKGMKIAMFSEKDHKRGWFRSGEDITYTLNKSAHSPKPFYVLSFTHEFANDNDVVSMAFAEPYTYSNLKKDISKFEKSLPKNCIFLREPLCTTVGGCTCEVLTVTSAKPAKEKKKAVILTARVHPGETVGSWMMKGILEFLSSKEPDARSLLERYVFKIVPCLNPDGVIQGNYRCSLAGCDLNRRYLRPSKILHPTIYYIKALARKISREMPIAFYCDLHGHSKKKDVFSYGNTGEDFSVEEYRLFPYVLSKITPFFSYKDSRFSVHKSKASTARVAMWKELGIPTIYTIEASFYGPTIEIGNEGHFGPEELIGMGRSICQALAVHSQIKEEVLERTGSEEGTFLAKKIMGELKRNPELLHINETKQSLASDVFEDGESSGSDSNPSENDMDPREVIKLISPHKNVDESAANITLDHMIEDLNKLCTGPQEPPSVLPPEKAIPVIIREKPSTEPKVVQAPLASKPRKPIMARIKTESEKCKPCKHKGPLNLNKGRVLAKKALRIPATRHATPYTEMLDGEAQTSFHSDFNEKFQEDNVGTDVKVVPTPKERLLKELTMPVKIAIRETRNTLKSSLGTTRSVAKNQKYEYEEAKETPIVSQKDFFIQHSIASRKNPRRSYLMRGRDLDPIKTSGIPAKFIISHSSKSKDDRVPRNTLKPAIFQKVFYS
eukprot:TRINITY_DN165_c0_g1_i1.p1 TRINITY_DN165_c0_g1~~TRINITY_DN165_c0_g1_i1.p1  ORF type:complete len:708 (+),score=63.26 TRINITY_DN165_c0_g1_i1:4323-6446(+)